MTGSDGSQSLVQILAIPSQTIPNLEDLTCDYSGNCSSSGRLMNWSGGSSKKEWVITEATKTLEGSTFKLESLNPEIVKVKQVKCTSSSCSNTQYNQNTYMYDFVGFGTAKIVATAPATAGYRAMNDTILITFKKGPNKMTDKYKDIKLSAGETKKGYLPEASLYKTPVTYTFNDKETSSYITKSGTDLVAGNENAVVLVTAHAPESDNYKEMHSSITVIVGDSSKAVNKEEYQKTSIIKTNPELPLQAVVAGNMLNINSNQPGEIEVEVFSITGQNVLNKTLSKNYGALSLANIPNGAYLITIRQGIKQLNVKWNKK